MGEKLRSIDFIVICLVIVSTVLFIILGNMAFNYEPVNDNSEDFVKATVIAVSDETGSDEYGTENSVVTFKCILDSGDLEGSIVTAEQYLTGNVAGSASLVEKNDKVLLAYTESVSDGEMTWQFVTPDRIKGIIILVLAFFVLIILIGRFKGLATIITLILTFGILFGVYIPAVLSGVDIYKSTIIASIMIILVTIIILNGLTKKTLCAIIGNVGGVAIAAILALVVNQFLGITGLVDEDSVLLTLLETDSPLNLIGLVWAGVVIGSLGAVMDVAVSLASSMQELSNEMKDKSFTRMVKSGFNIGRDAISTMTNTLILAYLGGSFSVILLFVAYNKNLYYLLNLELIVTEIIQGVVGSIGILMAVPATVIFAAWIFNNEKSA